jgi:hypothetical protein
MSRRLTVYLIHTPSLVLRQQRIHGILSQLNNVATQLGYTFNQITITKPEPEHIKDTLPTYEKRINYDSTGDAEFDKMIAPLSVEEISNYEKQREAWKRIGDGAADDLSLVIEDDTFLLPNMEHALKELFAVDHSTYDVLTLAISSNDVRPGDKLDIINVRKSINNFKILPSKDAYMISKHAARKLLDQTETIKFHMRHQLSYVFHKDQDIKLVHPSTRIFLEGSKIGIYTSSVHPNNILNYNQEYMELFKLMNTGNLDAQHIRRLYKQIAHLQNPDAMHVYGVLLFQAKEVKEAQDVLLEAIDLMQKQQGVMTFRSDLLNNLINIHEFTQWDLDGIMEKPSKYALSKK